MFLAACDAAQAKGAMLYFSNGQAIADGVQSVTATINGTNSTMNCPVAVGDAGGSYNAGLIIFYVPAGAPPVAKFTGTVNSTTGNAKSGVDIGNSQEAVAGLYLSALSWINGGTIPASALAAMQKAGVAKVPSKTIVKTAPTAAIVALPNPILVTRFIATSLESISLGIYVQSATDVMIIGFESIK